MPPEEVSKKILMKNIFICLLSIVVPCFVFSQNAVSPLPLPDSVKAIAFFSEWKIKKEPAKEGEAGISTDIIKLKIEKDKKERSFEFEFPREATIVALGAGVENEKGELEWKYNWTEGEVYSLMISSATDSAGNFSLFSGYVKLPKENKWKLIGTCRVDGRSTPLLHLYSFISTGKNSMDADAGFWVQRNTGSWRAFNESQSPPLVNLAGHLDSASREVEEKQIIERAIAEGKTPAKLSKEGVYYHIISEGTGKQVSVDDTVTVHYKGYLFSNNEVFDQTKETPARFPLKRLIRGWQIGVPLLRTGGKILLVIPSHLAYSIRTRASKIPPNSILVFEVEVLDATPPK